MNEPKAIGYYNGTVAPLEELTVPALDRAVYFGDGVYDVAYALNRATFALDDHLDRFERSCALIEMDTPVGREELRTLIGDMLSRLFSESDESVRDAMIYWQASRGTAPRAHNYPCDVKPNLFMYVKPKALPDMNRRLSLITTDDLRYELCHVKTLNLLPNAMANQKAVAGGYDEAILVRGGIVTECSHSSLHILSGGAFISHPADNRILPGITRKHCIELCRDNGIPVIEREFTPDELMAADEVLVTSTTTIIRAVDLVNGVKVGGRDDALLKKLQALYLEKIRIETGYTVK